MFDFEKIQIKVFSFLKRVQTERDKEESVEYDSVKKDSTSDDISEPVLIEEKPKKQPKKPKATETEDIDFNVNTVNIIDFLKNLDYFVSIIYSF